MLELIQAKYMTIITGEGINNFIIEYNEEYKEEEAFVVIQRANLSQN